MWIESLDIRNCRSLENVSVSFSPHLNIIIGENATGKTSLLESLSILSSGRSFRSSHITDVISYKKKQILVTAKIHKKDVSSQIGIEKSQNKTKIRINQQDIYSQAELSLKLPITVIHPDSINLITGSPTIRRSYIDWLAFYLYPEFYKKWKNYKHILKQRNLCLKSSKHRFALNKWTDELINYQPTINDYRIKVVEILNPIFKKISSSLLDNIDVNLVLKSGFPSDIKINQKSLSIFYNEKKDYDLKIKNTSSGVHRADLLINMDSKPAVQTASRGQLKLLAISLLLAQNQAMNIECSVKGILLIDDLAAELDLKNKEKLLHYLSDLKQQLIITSTKSIELKDIPYSMFHVKHGNIIKTV